MNNHDPKVAIASHKSTWQDQVDEIEGNIRGLLSNQELQDEVNRLRSTCKSLEDALNERTAERDYTFAALTRVKGTLSEKEAELKQLLDETKDGEKPNPDSNEVAEKKATS